VLTVTVSSDGVSSAVREADLNAPYALLRLQHRAATLRGDVRLVGPSEHGSRIDARFPFENSLSKSTDG
jgi:nitrate/nitrite-specific signal transduction histidine kinase